MVAFPGVLGGFERFHCVCTLYSVIRSMHAVMSWCCLVILQSKVYRGLIIVLRFRTYALVKIIILVDTPLNNSPYQHCYKIDLQQQRLFNALLSKSVGKQSILQHGLISDIWL